MNRRFTNDYSETCHPKVLEALARVGLEQQIAYGNDIHSENAKKLIRGAFGIPEADVHLLAGGTQSNMVVISYLLRPYEGVIACFTGHINTHETAAVEASGHKVLQCPGEDGKLRPCDIEAEMAQHTDEHTAKPRMIYISDTTELGTVYTLAELTALRAVCDKYGLYMFLDGARLGSALTAPGGDVKPEDIGRLCDAFYIGGTKNGLLFGEAVVFPNPELDREFRYHIKNRGAMLAKGYVPGIEFETVFEDGLYFRMAEHANRCAARIRDGLKALGVTFVGSSTSNQIFIRLPRAAACALMEDFGCEKWIEDSADEMTVRIVTSFATGEEDGEALVDCVRGFLNA